MLRSQQGFTSDDISGQGVFIAIIDSGIDYSHPSFRDELGNTKIEAIWDQTTGQFFYENEINEALSSPLLSRRQIVPQVDATGHGTAVAGIATDVAPGAKLLIVKLGATIGDSFPGTSRLMEGIDWVVNYAEQKKTPIVVNLSFGNNDGPHNGRSLLESFIEDISLIGRTSFVIGTGNEGDTGLHYQVDARLNKDKAAVTNAGLNTNTGFNTNSVQQISRNIAQDINGEIGQEDNLVCEFTIAYTQRKLNIQIWKSFIDRVIFEIELPNGVRSYIGNGVINYDGMKIYSLIKEPTPINNMEEINLDFVKDDDKNFLKGGVYKIHIRPLIIVNGRIDMWMPSGGVTQEQTRFLIPQPDTTLTVPSTAFSAISVGAIDADVLQVARFSGRGYLTNGLVKPDVGAPGSNILAPSVGGGYTLVSGTSFAAPFISGYCARMMQWGIILGNDTDLYGLKLKEVVKANANRENIKGLNYPNQLIGWGSYADKSQLIIEKN